MTKMSKCIIVNLVNQFLEEIYMKRLLALILVCIFTLSFTACDLGKIVNKDISHGTIDGNVYTNEFLGFEFIAPDGWVYATDEELAELLTQATDEVLDYSDLQKSMMEIQLVYDAMAQNPETGTNLIVIYENLAISGSADMTVDEYIELSKEQLNEIDFITYSFGEVSQVVLGDTEFTRLPMTSNYYEIVEMAQASYFAKIGNYMVTMSLTVTDDTPIETIESYFTEIK